MPSNVKITNNKALNIYIPKKIIEIGKKLEFNFSLIAKEAFKAQISIVLDHLDNLSREEKKKYLFEKNINIDQLIDEYERWKTKIYERTVEAMIENI